LNATEDVSLSINGGELKSERSNNVSGDGEVIVKAIQFTNLESQRSSHSLVLVDNTNAEFLSNEVVSSNSEGGSDITASMDTIGSVVGNRVIQSDVDGDPRSVFSTAVLPVGDDGGGGSDEEEGEGEDGSRI